MNELEHKFRIAAREHMLDMRDELDGLKIGSWARVYLMIAISKTLYNLGGMAGEW